MPSIGIVAGEVSGDILGADLISAISKLSPDARFAGIGGDRMKNAGCECLFPAESLAVMGISEVFRHFPQLLHIRKTIRNYFLGNRPDVFIGIDAPDFNFPLEKVFRHAGIKTVHYVSPSVWAWREYRLKSIRESVDLMLTLFPFEPPYYEKYNIPAKFVGHPLASKINLEPDQATARQQLGLSDSDDRIIALMPGSRKSEIRKLVAPFLKTAQWCMEHDSKLHFIANFVNEDARKYFEQEMRNISPEIQVTSYTGLSLTVMEAADVVLLASGTAALEAMLLKRPMVVAYKVNWLTYQIVKRLIRVPYVSLPNLLAGKQLVPECLQDNCQPEILGQEIMNWLNNRNKTAALAGEFRNIHEQIRLDSGEPAAQAILELIHGTA
jgi:lipid-A-disaccharide synthase